MVPLTATGTQCSSCQVSSISPAWLTLLADVAQVHQGFQTAYSSIAARVTSAIKSELSSHPGYKLTVTGHSLGGGIAAIATSSFIGQGLDVSSIYTFGEPRNGNSAWASYISSQISDSDYYRVTHYTDGVPQIPPTVLGYIHHGTEYFQSKQSDNSADSTINCGTNSTVSGSHQLLMNIRAKRNRLATLNRTLAQAQLTAPTSLTPTR